MARTIEITKAAPPANDVPYTRYALLNRYNLSLLAGALAASAAAGEPLVAVCAAAAEAVWLLFAPQSARLRERWFHPRWAAEREAARDARVAGKAEGLVPADRARVEALVAQRARIEALARANPSFATAMVKAELAKLGGLVEGFVELGVTAARSERYLASVDTAALQRAAAAYTAEAAAYPERDPRRAVAARNLAVLRQRSERYGDIGRALGTARGQMDLIENTFCLLADEIVTMASPSELGHRLEDLRIAVDAIRETTREAEIDPEEVDDPDGRAAARR